MALVNVAAREVHCKVVYYGPGFGGKTSIRNRSSFYGLRLAWRGIQLLGVAFGIAGGWYVTAWVKYGRAPLIQPVIRALSRTHVRTGWDSIPDPIVPPQWLLAVVGFLTVIALCMMLLGMGMPQ